MKDYRDVIIRPIITEQTVANQDQNKYTFEVAKNTNKIEVRQAVEYLFGVKVEKVNILNVKPTTKRYGRHIGKVSGYKKAVVTLAPGQEIDYYAE
jgi:large subunit ribosomal protein L23